MLFRAEIAASEGDLANAAALVDLVRARSANYEFFVKRDDGTDAANYVIGLYTDNGGFPDQAFAEAAVLYEHRLEMAMEGHRFYDIVRQGMAAEVFNGYLSRPQFRGYLGNVTFTEGKGIYPIPQEILDLAGGAFQQNPTY